MKLENDNSKYYNWVRYKPIFHFESMRISVPNHFDMMSEMGNYWITWMNCLKYSNIFSTIKPQIILTNSIQIFHLIWNGNESSAIDKIGSSSSLSKITFGLKLSISIFGAFRFEIYVLYGDLSFRLKCIQNFFYLLFIIDLKHGLFTLVSLQAAINLHQFDMFGPANHYPSIFPSFSMWVFIVYSIGEKKNQNRIEQSLAKCSWSGFQEYCYPKKKILGTFVKCTSKYISVAHSASNSTMDFMMWLSFKFDYFHKQFVVIEWSYWNLL